MLCAWRVTQTSLVKDPPIPCSSLAEARALVQSTMPGAILLQPEGLEPPPLLEVWG